VSEEHDEQEQVRRLLAAASGPDPKDEQLPEELARRLDDVLSGLVSERAGAPMAAAATEERATEAPVPADEVSGVTELASRRRRRWPQLLLAAAAVSVIALGVSIDDLTGSQGESAMSADAPSAATQDEADGEAGLAPERLDARSPEPEAAGPDRELSPLSERTAEAPRLRTGSLRADVQRLADFSLTSALSKRYSRVDPCRRPDTEAGDELLPVRLDGQRAVLVLRAPAGGRRTADVFACDDAGTPTASTTIDAR